MKREPRYFAPELPTVDVARWRYEDAVPPNHLPRENQELQRPDTPRPDKPGFFKTMFRRFFGADRPTPPVRFGKDVYRDQGNF